MRRVLRRSTASRITTALFLAACCLSCATSVHALTTFTPGTPAKADEVNANFTELADRITGLEAKHTSTTVNVDCASNPSALQSAVAEASEFSTLLISGTCDGPVRVFRQGLTLQAVNAGSDGIVGSGVFASGMQVLIINAGSVTVSGLKITATEPIGSTGVSVFNGGSATFDNLHVTGAEQSVTVARAGAARFENTTNIDLINVVDGAAARIEGGNGGFRIAVRRNGSVELRDTANGSQFTGIEVQDNAMFRSRGGAAITVNGPISITRNSSAFFQGALTLDHQPDGSGAAGLQVTGSSSLRLVNATIKSHTYSTISSGISASGSSFIDPEDDTKGALIKLELSSSLVLENGSTAGALIVGSNSSALLSGGSNLSGMAVPWEPSRSFALELLSGSTADVRWSHIADDVSVGSGGVLTLDGSSLNGDVLVWNNGTLDAYSGASISATPAAGGVCPTNFYEGIRLEGGSLSLSGDSSISGYIQVISTAVFSPFGPRDFTGSLDADQGSVNNMNEPGHTGINICN